MTDWLLDTLLWTAVLMVAVLAVRGAVAEKFGARVAYALWLLPIARLTMPTMTTTLEREPAAVGAGSGAGLSLSTDGIGVDVAVMNKTAGAVRTSALDTLTAWLETIDVGLLFLTVWGAGAIATFGWHQLRYYRDRRAVLAAGTRRGRFGGIELIVSPEAPGPMALGTLRRVIALPQTYLDACSDTELELALEHELSHHRSGDLWARQAGLVLLSLHWFNPIAWKAYAAFHFDQEAACDARVLARRGSAARADYGRAIARSAAPLRILTANARDTDLKRRLTMMKNVSHRPLGVLLIAAAAVVIVPATASRAVAYVDGDAPEAPAAPLPPEAPRPPKAPEAPKPPEAPLAPLAASLSAMQDLGEGYEGEWGESETRRVMTRGGSKPYSQMTPAERAEFDAVIRELRSELAELRAERPEVMREFRVDMREAREEARRESVEAEAEIAEGLREIDEAIAEVRAESAEIRAEGGNPEAVIAGLQAARSTLAAMDMGAIIESSLSSVDESIVVQSLDAAEVGMTAALRDMEARRNR
ncbi:M56 family metallopeptidase [Sphingomicrobium sp. XHP0239]|uniref:M56 family metallopeptidase n=1 Tax=Sphingomicrobium maritimum TaxID=3133972 RepID=UPI0031CCAFB9